MIREIVVRMHPHPTQELVHNCPARFKLVICGKRWGKTTLGCGEVLDRASKGGRAWWIAPDYKRAREGWDPLLDLCRGIPGSKINLTDREIGLPGGGRVQVRSSDDPDSLRGPDLDLAVFDEAAFQSVIGWYITRTALVDRRGDAMFISSPAGLNWLYHMHRQATQCPIVAERIDNPDGTPKIVLHGTCDECPVKLGESKHAAFNFHTKLNPHLSAEEIAELERDMPERVRMEEVEARFLSNGSGLFRNVEELSTSAPLDKAGLGHAYVIGADWGITTDPTVFSVFDVTERRQVHLRRITNPDTIAQENSAVALWEAFGKCPFMAEANSIGEPMIQRLRARGLPVIPWITSQASKDVAIRDLMFAFERKELRILPDEQQCLELNSLECTRTATGLPKYAAPDGMHDDIVIANMIAWQGCKTPQKSATVAGGRPSIEQAAWL